MIKTHTIQKKLLAAVFLIALVTLIGWYTNNLILTRISDLFLPMAPLTAVFFILIVLANYLRLSSYNKYWTTLTKIFTLLLIVIQAVIVFDILFISHALNVERFLINTSELYRSYPIGQISEGSVFLFNCTAIAFLFSDKIDKSFYHNLYGIVTLIIFLVSSIFLLAYIQRFPILFDARLVPISLPAAFSFWLLSWFQLKVINFQIWPFKLLNDNSTYNIVLKKLIPVVILLLFVQEIIENYVIVEKKDPIVSMLFMMISVLVIVLTINKITLILGDKLDKAVKNFKVSEQKFQSLFNNVTIGLYQSTPDGKVLSANKALLNILQFNSFDELLKIDISQGSYLHSEKRNEFKEKLAQYGEITNFESEWVTKYGKVIYVKEGARAIKDENGTIIRYEGVVEDITVQKLNQQKLEEKDVKIKNFFENSKVIYFSHNVDFELLYVSPQITEILGYQPAEVKNNRTRFYTDNPINILRLNETMETLKTGIKNPPFELEIYHKNGSKMWFEVNEIPVVKEGKIIGIDGSLTDITERKRNAQIQQILLNISNESQFTTNLIDFYYFIHQELNKIINAENFYIALYVEENDAIHIPYYKDELDDETDFPAKGTLTGLLLNEGKSLLLKEQEMNQLIEDKKLNIIGNDCKIWLGVPLKLNNKAIGAIVVQSYNDENAYTQKDVELIELIANQIAISIERKRFKDELIVSKELAEQKSLDYSYLTKNIQGMIYRALPDWSVSFITNCIPLTGYSDKSFLDGSINWYNLIVEEDLDKVIKQGAVLTQQPASIIQEYRIRTRNKTIKHVIDYKTSIFDKDNNFKGVDGIVFDSTEQKLMQDELIHAKEKAEESEYNLKERVKELNGLFSLGVLADKYDNLEDIYTEFIQMVVPNSMQFPDKTIALLEINGKSYSNTTNFNHYKNNYKLSAPIKVFENINGMLSVTYTENIPFLDIYEQQLIDAFAERISKITEHIKSLHNLKNALEKAEENDRLKTAFLANMSHEIRTPMNSILGFSELLMNQELSEEKQEKYHEIVNNSGKRLMNLINDIVDISKIDANEIKLNPTVFNLNALIDQLQQQFSIAPKNMNTVINTVKSIPDNNSFMKCDETRLAQVLSNLLENALKFTHNGTVEFGYTLGEKEVQFFVKDSGVGIDVKDHQHIFERFGQSDNEILKVKEGSGLGLSISKGIVELFGGKIWVESEPNQGATFYFTISNNFVQLEQKEKAKNNDTIVESKTTKTILIAEDEETNFWFLEAALESHPFELIHVLNGKEAFEIMQNNHNIDLILMDFNMPVMNGLVATKEIRKINSEIPIIAVTAYAMAADRDKALSHGCTDYITKPIHKVDLLEKIYKYVQNYSKQFN